MILQPNDPEDAGCKTGANTGCPRPQSLGQQVFGLILNLAGI